MTISDIFKVKDTANSQSPLVANELIALNESNVACLGIAHILQAGLFSDITIQVMLQCGVRLVKI